ncbi:MAG: hypothetical protein KF785_17135 [Gemmatimonadales bacterium]|nr:hypothetical protein [Gemmatimonadales bacterium]
MPVMPKLSRRFYEVLGEDVVDQMAEWFNQMGEAYRADWRLYHDAGFGRSNAKLEHRLSELEHQIERRFSAIDLELYRKFADMDRRIDRLEAAMAEGFRDLRNAVARD